MKVVKKIPDTYNAKQWLGATESDEVSFLQMHKDSKDALCSSCGKPFSRHGVMAKACDKRWGAQAICPGHWIVRDSSGAVVQIMEDVFFKDTYEPA